MTHGFRLTAELDQFKSDAARIARDELVNHAGKAAAGRVNRPLLAALGTTGLLGHVFPSAADGRETSAMRLCLLREALASVCTEAETALALQGLGAYPILQSASSDLVKRWIPEVAAGTAVAAFALTEPEHGSDAAALALRAEECDGGFRLSGTKTYISNAPEADVYSVFARTGEASGAKGVSAFVVPGATKGLTGESIPMLSPHPIGRLEFDSVFVPSDHLLGDRGAGFKVAMRTLDLFRPSVGAFAVGMSQAALTCALEHAKNRQAFGKPIGDFQAISHRLADMSVRLEAARLLVYRAAAAFDAGQRPNTANAAMAKLFATEAAHEIVDGAIQILGARALESHHPLAHLYREVRAPRIYEGTSEIQRNIIARELLG